MKLCYLFSRNNLLGSKLISWASGLLVKELEKVPSHMAILLESKDWPDGIVFESTLTTGVRIVPYKNWKELNEECYKIECKREVILEEIVHKIQQYWGKKYDWLGILFFAICFIKHLLFKIDFPKDNAWQSDDKYFCNELGGEISGYSKYSMVTPAKMCLDFLNSNDYNRL
jgi:hypothetical protein